MALITRASKGSNLTPAEADADLVYLEALANLKASQTDFDLLETEVGTKADQSSISNIDNTSDANKPVSTAQQTALNLKADLASPTLSGVPLSPTASPGTNTTQIASTAFVQAATAALVASSPATLDTLNELAAALGNDANFAATTATSLGLKAPLASPTFTGVPAAPTASANTNTTQIATTAFVTAAVAVVAPSPASASQTISSSTSIDLLSYLRIVKTASSSLTTVAIALTNNVDNSVLEMWLAKTTASDATYTFTGATAVIGPYACTATTAVLSGTNTSIFKIKVETVGSTKYVTIEQFLD